MLPLYTQNFLCAERRGGKSRDAQACNKPWPENVLLFVLSFSWMYTYIKSVAVAETIPSFLGVTCNGIIT